ncbi:MAG: hypothetical protein KDD15_17975 [Lewinella sp.]|nr:hypothetical protein [Lewinella sp.]
MSVEYDFNDPIFKKVPLYRRLAREHLSIADLKSDRIKWRAVETATHLNIPIRYQIDYLFQSIIGINEDQSPLYGAKHTIEVSFPASFPRETFKARAITNLWHPNIKWEGPTKGRICVNNQNFGRGYDLYWYLLRIGEIIQWKNYLAENIWPYPEDATVAKWVLNYAEPKGLMSIKDKKPVDESNLLEYTPEKEPEKKIIIKEVNRSKIRIKRPPQNGGD